MVMPIENNRLFKHILAYASVEDRSLMAVEQAASLARTHQAVLTIVRVLRDGGAASLWKWANESGDVRRIVEEDERAPLDVRAAALREEGLDVRVEVRWGAPWEEIIHLVLRQGHDLVVKAAEGAVGGRGLFFGSNALHLIRKCPCAVWVVGRAGGTDARRVLAAVDPAQDEVRSALARRILEMGLTLTADSGELHAVSAWDAPSEHLFRSRGVAQEHVEQYVHDVRAQAQEGLATAVREAGGPLWSEHVHLLKGDPKKVIAQFVKRRKFDLVVMGSVGRVGLEGFLIGETAETIIRSVQCSVLVVKPAGFVSPIKLPAAGGSVAMSERAGAHTAPGGG